MTPENIPRKNDANRLIFQGILQLQSLPEISKFDTRKQTLETRNSKLKDLKTRNS